MVLVVDGLLEQSPLKMGFPNRRVLGNDAREIPIEEVWVVEQRLDMDVVIVVNDRASLEETSSDASANEVLDVEVGDESSGIEALNRKLTDGKHGDSSASVCEPGSLSIVDIRPVGGAHDIVQLALREPGGQDSKFLLNLGRPEHLPFLHGVLRETKANQLIVLNVGGDLGVHLASHEIIIGVLAKVSEFKLLTCSS
jgi:hypothetical protein